MKLVDYSSSDSDHDDDDEAELKHAPRTSRTVAGASSANSPPPQSKASASSSIPQKRKSSPSPSSHTRRDARGAATGSGSGTGTRTTGPSSALPPLPTRFHDLYATAVRKSTRDDPTLHGGRARVTPHVEGNWPTHVYIEWHPSPTHQDILQNLISTLQTRADSSRGPKIEIHSFLTSDLGAPLPLHISLSRPIGFSTAVKDAFLSALQSAIQSCRVRSFTTSPFTLAWVANFNGTRWFLVLRVTRPAGNGLNELLRVCNRTVIKFGELPLYTAPAGTMVRGDADASAGGASSSIDDGQTAEPTEVQEDAGDAFHVSIAWSLQAPSEELLAATRQVSGAEESEGGDGRKGLFEEVKKIEIPVDEVKAKIGNVITSIALSRGARQGEVSLFGL